MIKTPYKNVVITALILPASSFPRIPKLIGIGSLLISLLFSSMHTFGERIDRTDLTMGFLVSNVTTARVIPSGGTQQVVKGRLNLDLFMSKDTLLEGRVLARDVTLALFNVDYAHTDTRIKKSIASEKKATLALKETKGESQEIGGRNHRGVLSFSMDRSGKRDIFLKYDRRASVLSAKIPGFSDNGVLAAPDQETLLRDLERTKDYTLAPLQKAALEIRIELLRPLPEVIGEKRVPLRGNVSYTLTAVPANKPGITSSVAVGKTVLEAVLYSPEKYERASELCLQPIRLKSDKSWESDVTGEVLYQQIHVAKNQWAKANVALDVRETIFYPLNPVAHHQTIPGEISNSNYEATSDCIEIYAVETLSNDWGVSLWGITILSGSIAAKILLADSAANKPIGLTTLGHEIGHVLSLDHPWEDAKSYPNYWEGGKITLSPASTGTLMCYGKNHEQLLNNSQENKDLISNGLLKLNVTEIKGAAGPLQVDCQYSSDCGPC